MKNSLRSCLGIGRRFLLRDKCLAEMLRGWCCGVLFEIEWVKSVGTFLGKTACHAWWLARRIETENSAL